MNIFPLDTCPKLAAQYLHDFHIRKMNTESAQILSTILHRAGQSAPYEKVRPEDHPAILWAEQSKENFDWVLQHGIEICFEFEKRFGHPHKSFQALSDIQSIHFRPPEKELSKFGQFIPEKYQQADSVQAYRDAYAGEKIVFAHYSFPSEPPTWLWEKVIRCYPTNVAEIKNGKIKISHNFWSDLSSFLEDELKNKKKEVFLSKIFLHFSFGSSSDFPLPILSKNLLSISEKKFYSFQFLISFLTRQEMLPGWRLITGKNARLKFQKLK